MNEIICPLLTTNTVVDEDNKVKIGTQPVYCLEKQCAWWHYYTNQCAILTLAGATVGIDNSKKKELKKNG